MRCLFPLISLFTMSLYQFFDGLGVGLGLEASGLGLGLEGLGLVNIPGSPVNFHTLAVYEKHS